MINKSKLIVMAVLSISCWSASALAQVRVSAASCWNETSNSGDYTWRDGIANLSSGLGWRPRLVFCPISDSLERPRTTISNVAVDIVDGNNQFGTIHNFQGRVCLMPVGSSVAELAPVCSSMIELNPGTTTGTRTVFLPADAISLLRDTTRTSFLATLVVQIPANNGWPSTLRGYRFFY